MSFDGASFLAYRAPSTATGVTTKLAEETTRLPSQVNFQLISLRRVQASMTSNLSTDHHGAAADATIVSGVLLNLSKLAEGAAEAKAADADIIGARRCAASKFHDCLRHLGLALRCLAD